MNLEFELPLVSFIFLLMINLIYFSKRKVNLLENKPYYFILVSSLIVAAIDTVLHFISSFTDTDGLVKYYEFVNVSNRIIALLFIVVFASFFCYIMFISYEKIKNDPKKVVIPVEILVIISCFLLSFMNVEIIETETARNVTGPAITYGYIWVAILLVLSLIVSKINMKKNDKRFMSVFLILIMLAVMYTLTILFPGIIIYDVILALMCYIMYFTIENPDVKMVEQLEAANIVAEKANRAKSDFLSSMSHEIRTPLNAIVGFSECIKNCDTLEEAKENANDVISASQTLLEIVNGILDISKIEAGKLEIINSDYNFKKLLNDVIKLINARIGDKQLEFKVNIAEDIPEVLYGDHLNVKKIAINLLTNAVKYTDKGYVKFEVSCVKTDDICRILLSVEDSGRGIKKENIDKLFTKFQRLDEDKNTTIEGTGLGLAITKQLVEMMNGNIVVSSIYGKGSKFIAAIDQRVSYKEIEEKVEEETNEKIDLTDKKILVVDDNKLNLKVAKKLLEIYNPTLDFADSGMKCLEKIKEGNEYDLILMDDMMPKMRGGETLTRLKKIPNFNIPTVALTANAVSGMKEQYLKDGFNDYLSKPIDKNELHEILKRNILNCVAVDKEQPVGEQTNKSIEEPIQDKKEIKTSNENNIPNYSDKKVLIVDDNNLNIKVASIVLKPYNINIESVNSGNEAVVKIKEGNVYDLIFMDDMMPELNGVETFHKLEQIENFNIPVVMLTANAIEGAREKYLSEGLNDYLSKPIDKKEMNRVLNKFLNNSKIDKTEQEIKYLKDNGIDMDYSLSLLGDIEIYNETLKEFKDNLNERIEKLSKFKQEKDMESYAIEIHALKSDSKYLGFTNLANLAYKQEIESKKNNLDFINENYNSLIEELIKNLKIVNNR